MVAVVIFDVSRVQSMIISGYYWYNQRKETKLEIIKETFHQRMLQSKVVVVLVYIVVVIKSDYVKSKSLD